MIELAVFDMAGTTVDDGGRVDEALRRSVEEAGATVAPEDLIVVLDALVTTDDVPEGRPAPYLVHRAMERTGTHDVARVLVAGDTVVDIEAGRHSGGIACGVLTGKASRELLATARSDHILDSVAGVLDLPETQPTEA